MLLLTLPSLVYAYVSLFVVTQLPFWNALRTSELLLPVVGSYAYAIPSSPVVAVPRVVVRTRPRASYVYHGTLPEGRCSARSGPVTDTYDRVVLTSAAQSGSAAAPDPATPP